MMRCRISDRTNAPTDSEGRKLDEKNKPLRRYLFDQDEEDE